MGRLVLFFSWFIFYPIFVEKGWSIKFYYLVNAQKSEDNVISNFWKLLWFHLFWWESIFRSWRKKGSFVRYFFWFVSIKCFKTTFLINFQQTKTFLIQDVKWKFCEHLVFCLHIFAFNATKMTKFISWKME